MTSHCRRRGLCTKTLLESGHGLLALGAAVGLSVAVAACAAAPVRLSPSPTAPRASPTSTAMTPAPLETPCETSTPTAVPTVTPTTTSAPEMVAELVEVRQTSLAARGIKPLCMQWEDTDGDGEGEWAGLYLRPGDPPRLEGFVLDGDVWYELSVPEEDEHGLGTYPACELEISDVNLDGRQELLVRGRATENVDLLHLFVWGEDRYDLLASFRGDAGIVLDDTDGDLLMEVIARYKAGDGLAWEAVHTWDGTHYAWTWERYGWLYPDHPHSCPTGSPDRAVICYYLALHGRDLPAAHRLLSPQAPGYQPYTAWARGFDTLLAVEVGSVHEITREGETPKITAQVRSYETLDGYVIGHLWDVTWTMVRDGDAWRLTERNREQLDRWEASYFE